MKSCPLVKSNLKVRQKEGGLGVEPPGNVLLTTPFTLAANVKITLFSTTIVSEKT